MFYNGANVIKLFLSVFNGYLSQLECLSLANLSSLVYCLWARPRARAFPREEHLKGYSIG
jgi:hypothetical protein